MIATSERGKNFVNGGLENIKNVIKLYNWKVVNYTHWPISSIVFYSEKIKKYLKSKN